MKSRIHVKCVDPQPYFLTIEQIRGILVNDGSMIHSHEGIIVI